MFYLPFACSLLPAKNANGMEDGNHIVAMRQACTKLNGADRQRPGSLVIAWNCPFGPALIVSRLYIR